MIGVWYPNAKIVKMFVLTMQNANIFYDFIISFQICKLGNQQVLIRSEYQNYKNLPHEIFPDVVMRVKTCFDKVSR